MRRPLHTHGLMCVRRCLSCNVEFTPLLAAICSRKKFCSSSCYRSTQEAKVRIYSWRRRNREYFNHYTRERRKDPTVKAQRRVSQLRHTRAHPKEYALKAKKYRATPVGQYRMCLKGARQTAKRRLKSKTLPKNLRQTIELFALV